MPKKQSPDKSIFKQAVEKWGHTSQINMMIEECSEMITTLRHLDRGRASHADVCGEVADLEIMCEQMRVMFNPRTINRFKVDKLLRLRKRINR